MEALRKEKSQFTMPISHQYKTIFVHIPKTGGTSIEKTLGIKGNPPIPDHAIFYGFRKGKYLQHLTALEIKKMVSVNVYNNYFKFSFVRNPYDKLVSDFLWFKNHAHLPEVKAMDFEDFLFKRVIPIRNNEDINQKIRFAESQHYQDQYKFITDEKKKKIVEFIGRFENLQKDFEKVCRHIGIETTKLPHLFNSGCKDHRSYYNRKTKNAVTRIYKEDLEMFGYHF